MSSSDSPFLSKIPVPSSFCKNFLQPEYFSVIIVKVRISSLELRTGLWCYKIIEISLEVHPLTLLGGKGKGSHNK